MAEPWLPLPAATLPTLDTLVTIGVFLLLVVGGIVGIWIKFSVLHAATSGGESEKLRMNCPECGARNPVSRDHCEYCEEPLPVDT